MCFCQHRALCTILQGSCHIKDAGKAPRVTKQKWECPLPEQCLHRAWAAPDHQEHPTQVVLLLPSFSSTKTTTAGNQTLPLGVESTIPRVSLRIGYQVTSLQLHLAVLGNSLLPSLPSIMKHHIQHLGGAVPHCLGTFHSFFFPPAIHSELFYKEQHNINISSL